MGLTGYAFMTPQQARLVTLLPWALGPVPERLRPLRQLRRRRHHRWPCRACTLGLRCGYFARGRVAAALGVDAARTRAAVAHTMKSRAALSGLSVRSSSYPLVMKCRVAAS